MDAVETGNTDGEGSPEFAFHSFDQIFATEVVDRA